MRIIIYWYCNQAMYIKWKDYTFSPLEMTLGKVPYCLFAFYVDELSHFLSESNTGCHIGNCCMKHFVYADDICTSPSGFQNLFNICDDFEFANCISFNF